LTVKARSLVWLVICLYISQGPAASPTTNYLQGKVWNKTWMVTTYIRSWSTSHRNVIVSQYEYCGRGMHSSFILLDFYCVCSDQF
jgi:hypothetical protein